MGSTTLTYLRSYSIRHHTPNILSFNRLPLLVARTSTPTKCLLLTIIPVVVAMLLLLAGDVERNPGPITGELITRDNNDFTVYFAIFLCASGTPSKQVTLVS